MLSCGGCDVNSCIPHEETAARKDEIGGETREGSDLESVLREVLTLLCQAVLTRDTWAGYRPCRQRRHRADYVPGWWILMPNSL